MFGSRETGDLASPMRGSGAASIETGHPRRLRIVWLALGRVKGSLRRTAIGAGFALIEAVD